MAIQIRRGSNAEWETNNSNIVVGEPAVATDSKRAFIGTASGAYMELANLEAIAPAYDPGNSYMIDDYVSYQGKLYVCTVPTSGAWDASAWQVTSLGQALAENAYSNYETYTMSGDIVSFPNGAGGVPVKDLQVGIEAVQDLHGYDHPWVGGAGKNMLQNEMGSGSSKGVTYSTDDNGVTTLTGSATGNLEVLIGTVTLESGTEYKINGNSFANANCRMQLKRTLSSSSLVQIYDNSDVSYTPSETGEYYVTMVVITGNNPNGLKIYPMVRLASVSDATFAPYSNICPISGWTGANIYVSPTADEEDATVYSITWQTEAGTVYGGTFDVTTGVLTITHIYVKPTSYGSNGINAFSSSVYFSYDSSYPLQAGVLGIISNVATGATRTSANCSAYGIVAYGNTTSRNVGVAGDINLYPTEDSLRQALLNSNAEFVIPLATPQTVQLTPQQVRTLLGENNIWADSGEVEVTYRISNVQ